MKITKSYLKQVIKEEMNKLEEADIRDSNVFKNRVKTYMRQGLTQADAEAKAQAELELAASQDITNPLNRSDKESLKAIYKPLIDKGVVRDPTK